LPIDSAPFVRKSMLSFSISHAITSSGGMLFSAARYLATSRTSHAAHELLSRNLFHALPFSFPLVICRSLFQRPPGNRTSRGFYPLPRSFKGLNRGKPCKTRVSRGLSPTFSIALPGLKFRLQLSGDKKLRFSTFHADSIPYLSSSDKHTLHFNEGILNRKAHFH